MRKLTVLLFAIVVLASCKNFKQPEYAGIQNVKINEASLDKSSKVTLYLKFFNPNTFSAKLKHAQGDVWMDSTYLGPFVVEEKIKLPAKAEFIVPVTITMDLKKFAMQSLMMFDKKEVTLKATGTLKAGRSLVSKTVPLKYEKKHDLQTIIAEIMKNPPTK